MCYATFLGVLETILSLALGSKPGPHEENLSLRAENTGYDDHLDKMVSGYLGLSDTNSTYCGLL